ncbi:MAG TPA: DUF3800 domain-containing protein [Fimbriimonas sp.]|nr:DUF3800 domain-containing protein [Fimbriimonas sp.]
MHLCFVDESGHPPPPDKIKAKFFVLGAIIIPEGVWHGFDEEFRRAKSKYGVRGEVKWRHFSPHNQDAHNSIAHLNEEERNSFRDVLFGIIRKYKSVRLIAAAADIKRAYEKPYVSGSSDLYHLSYKQVTERFQYHLQDQSREVGSEIQGIVVIDHRGAHDDQRLRSKHADLIESGGLFTSNYANLVEGLFIAPSHMSVGIQFADLVAGAVFRFLEKGDAQFFDKIKPSFRSSPKGDIRGYGLVMWPK